MGERNATQFTGKLVLRGILDVARPVLLEPDQVPALQQQDWDRCRCKPPLAFLLGSQIEPNKEEILRDQFLQLLLG